MLALLLAGCGGSGDANGEGRLEVAATTTQVGDLVRAVGGDTVTVNQVLKPNAEPHDYEPRPADVAALADAKLVFASGLGLDEWASKMVEDSGSGARVVNLGEGLPVRRGGAQPDPHWWHDPENLEAATTRVERALVAADPEARRQVEANADAYRKRIRRLDREIRACLERIPERERVIVTDHDAFAYFTGRYGIRSVGAILPSASTQGQASAGELARLQEAIRRERVRAIFPESSLSPALAEQVARETGASARHTLYGDTLGPAGSPAATILGAAAANAEALAEGISGGRVKCEITP